MGGVSQELPLTSSSINVANLALCAAPFLAGFYPKDLVLEAAFSTNLNTVGFLLYTFATGLTVIYTARLIFISLCNTPNTRARNIFSEKSQIMINPMLVLRLGAIAGGSLGG